MPKMHNIKRRDFLVQSSAALLGSMVGSGVPGMLKEPKTSQKLCLLEMLI